MYTIRDLFIGCKTAWNVKRSGETKVRNRTSDSKFLAGNYDKCSDDGDDNNTRILSLNIILTELEHTFA